MHDTWCNSVSPAGSAYLDTSFGPNQGRIQNYRCRRRFRECWCNSDHIRLCSKCTRHRLKVNIFSQNNNKNNGKQLPCSVLSFREKTSRIQLLVSCIFLLFSPNLKENYISCFPQALPGRCLCKTLEILNDITLKQSTIITRSPDDNNEK